MKKKIAMFLSSLLVVSMLSGCGSETTATNTESNTTTGTENTQTAAEQTEPVNITIWHCADATIADTLQKQVDTLAPEIVVTFERKENMSDALKLVGDDLESAPDMFLWAHDKVGTFAQMGILSPITDVLSEDELADFLPMTLSAGEYQGNKYQLPLYYEALLFMYNKDLMETAPETTDELLALMESETQADQYVFVEQHSTAYNAAAWIQGFGGYLINEDREPGLNLPQTVEAMEYHKQFVSYMPADGEYNTVTTLFTEGKAASTIGGPWLVPGIKEAGINLGIASMPILPNGTSLTPFSGVQGIHVLKHAAETKKEALAEVLKVLGSKENGVSLANAASCAPANSKSYEDASVSENEMIMALKTISGSVVPMPNIPEMDVMWSVTDDLLAAVNKRGEDVQTVCDAHQKEALEQISAMQ